MCVSLKKAEEDKCRVKKVTGNMLDRKLCSAKYPTRFKKSKKQKPGMEKWE